METTETTILEEQDHPPIFNQPPSWLAQHLVFATRFLEQYGWPIVVAACALWWLMPFARQKIQELRSAGRAEADDRREAMLEQLRQQQVQSLQQKMSLEGREWEAEKAEKDAQLRRRRLKELEEKAKRLGFSPKGNPHFARLDKDKYEDDDLYS